MMRATRALSICLLLLAAGTARAADPTPAPRAEPLRVGVDANYALGMETNGTAWRWGDQPEDLFAGMARHGVGGLRIRLWTKDEGAHGRRYATEVMQRALRGGLDPYLVVFLSDDWSDMMKQPLAAAWQGLSFDERKAAVRAYSREVVTHFRQAGLRSHLYEIGNEIDYGICGEYPGKSTKKNPAALSRQLWPRSAELIQASQAGVREADPEATFLLHIAHWWDAEFCIAFFRFMREHGAQVDFAGLSYFPSANIGGSLDFEQFGDTVTRLAAAIGRPIIVPETAYPSTRAFTGQFSRWKYESMGYPLTPDGQRRWLADFLAYCHRLPAIHSVYYWSPEWCGEGMWKGFALFDPDGAARPAWSSFTAAAWSNQAPRATRFVEVRSNRLFTVPVAEAKAQLVPLVERLRKQTGGVNVEHIALLTNTPLRVGDYAVDPKGSLQQNLNLTLHPEARGLALDSAEARAAAAGTADPAADRLVVIASGEPPAQLDAWVESLRREGRQVVLHPRPDGLPLKFGMCGAFAAAPDTGASDP